MALEALFPKPPEKKKEKQKSQPDVLDTALQARCMTKYSIELKSLYMQPGDSKGKTHPTIYADYWTGSPFKKNIFPIKDH